MHIFYTIKSAPFDGENHDVTSYLIDGDRVYVWCGAYKKIEQNSDLEKRIRRGFGITDECKVNRLPDDWSIRSSNERTTPKETRDVLMLFV